MEQQLDDPVIQAVPLGAQWPTIDPFLFCAHHDDAYPAGNEALGPAAPLTGREIGADFAGIDGWSMYHGDVVPGFPQHPHRGFETVTYVRTRDHRPLRLARRRGPLRARRHAVAHRRWRRSCTPRCSRCSTTPGPTRSSCSRSGSTSRPSTRWPTRTSRCCGATTSRASATSTTTVASVEITRRRRRARGARAPGAAAELLGRARRGRRRDLGDPHGPGRDVDAARGRGSRHRRARSTSTTAPASRSVGTRSATDTGAVVHCDVAGRARRRDGGVEILVLQGRPIGEPVEQYGPFVMNDREGIAQAFADYQRTGFGGWPWPADDPVHGDAEHGALRPPRRRPRRAALTSSSAGDASATTARAQRVVGLAGRQPLDPLDHVQRAGDLVARERVRGCAWSSSSVGGATVGRHHGADLLAQRGSGRPDDDRVGDRAGAPSAPPRPLRGTPSRRRC